MNILVAQLKDLKAWLGDDENSWEKGAMIPFKRQLLVQMVSQDILNQIITEDPFVLLEYERPRFVVEEIRNTIEKSLKGKDVKPQELIDKYLTKKMTKKIASELGIAENTVRSRVNKLQEEGIMEISAHVNPQKTPDYKMIIVGVKLNTMNGVKKGKEISKLRNIVSVSAVTGRYDLLLIVALSKDFGLTEFITEEMDRIEDIQSIETFIVYSSFNMHIPYM